MKHGRIRQGIGLLLSGCVVVAHAAPLTRVATLGPVMPAQPLWAAMALPTHGITVQALRVHRQAYQDRPIPLATLQYPVHSSLTPGRVTPHAQPVARLTRPIFLIGNDPYSIAWAKHHADSLTAIHAVGLITNVDTPAQTQAIERQTGLKLTPMAGSGIGQWMGVAHYPWLWQHGEVSA